jgi:Tol biopolymer transport system component
VVAVKRLSVLVTVWAVMLLVPVVTGQAQAKVPGPNGQIVFSRHNNDLDTNAIYLVNPDGSHLRPLSFPYDMDVPHWSPDGSKIAFNSGLNLPCPPTCVGHTVIIDPDTGDYRILQPPDPNMFTSCVVWSPDATHFACHGESESDPSANGVYTIRSSDGGGLTRITDAGGGIDVPIDYSPDGNQIVFGRLSPNFDCSTKSALFVVNVDGSGLRQITPPGFCDDDGSWSPDGSKIAFEHRGSIFTVHPDGTGLAKVALKTRSLSYGGDISWSPDGTKMAFILVLQTGPNTFTEGIGTANADGTDVRQITIAPSGFKDHQTDWGPHPLAT